VDAASAALRRASPPVVARVRDDAIIFDLRTISERELDEVVAAAQSAAL
jgi:seryl-tRNA(Sec) selenium transferase